MNALLTALDKTVTKATVLGIGRLVCEGRYSVEELLELTFHRQPEVAFRAAWVLEQVVDNCLEVFRPNLGGFLARYPRQENPSCRRHFAKIMVFLIVNRMIPKDDQEPVIEATFDWLIDSRMPVAVQAHCLEALFHLSKEVDWVGPELKAQTEFLMKQGSPGIRARGRKVLAGLRAEGFDG